MTEVKGMYVHPFVMMVMVAAISVMLTIIVLNRPAAPQHYTSAGIGISNPSAAGGVQLYQSTMHPWIVQDHPGTCPICGMELVPMAPADQEEYLANHPEFT